METNDKRLLSANAVMWLFQMLYTVSPIDIIPDIIPLLGWMDDGLLFLITVGFTAFTMHRMYKAGTNPLDMLGGLVGAKKGAIDTTTATDAVYEPLDPIELQRL